MKHPTKIDIIEEEYVIIPTIIKEIIMTNNTPEIIDEYARYMAVIRNRSRGTISEYINDLTLFFRFILASRQKLGTDDDTLHAVDLTGLDLETVGSVTTAEVYEFLFYAKNQRGNEARALARKLSSIKGYYKYLTTKVHKLEHNPAIDIDTPDIKQSLPKFLTMEESLDLLAAVQNDRESKTRLRDYAIVTLFLNCGMRLSELVGISLSDMDPQLRSLRVIGKGSKERIIYLNEACRTALTEYLLERAKDPEIKDKDALFLSSRHTRISNKTVQWMIYKYLDMAGLGNRKLSTHKLRHTAATLMYQTGKVDVRVLKDILGHEQLNTTQIYTHVSDAGMEQAMENNPLSGVKRKPSARSSKTEDEQ